MTASTPARAAKLDGIARQPFFARLPRLLVFALLIHHLDLITRLFGPVTISRATLIRRCPAVSGENTAEIDMRTAQGVEVRLTGSFCRSDKPEMPMDDMEIVGDRARLRFVDGLLTLAPGRAPPEVFPFERSDPASYAGAIGDFVDGLLAQRPFETEAPEHVAILRLVEEIYARAGDPETQPRGARISWAAASLAQPRIAR